MYRLLSFQHLRPAAALQILISMARQLTTTSFSPLPTKSLKRRRHNTMTKSAQRQRVTLKIGVRRGLPEKKLTMKSRGIEELVDAAQSVVTMNARNRLKRSPPKQLPQRLARNSRLYSTMRCRRLLDRKGLPGRDVDFRCSLRGRCMHLANTSAIPILRVSYILLVSACTIRLEKRLLGFR